MTFSPQFQTPAGDSFIGRLTWTEDTNVANTGTAFVFRSANGDVYYVDQADETGAKMNEAQFTFSAHRASVYMEKWRLDSTVVTAAQPRIRDGAPVAASNGVVGNSATIQGGYRSIQLLRLSAGGLLVDYNTAGGVAAGWGYTIGGAGMAEVGAGLAETVAGQIKLEAQAGAVVEIIVEREG